MESLNRLSPGTLLYDKISRSISESANASPKDIIERNVKRYNESAGSLNMVDGYNCKKCQNRGNTARCVEENGNVYECYEECDCMTIRRSIARMKASGLEKTIKQYTFYRFEARTEWQKKMIDTARKYVQDGARAGKWLFIGGAVGSGKTHICTACAGRLLYQMSVKYMTWPDESARLKALVNYEDEYRREMTVLKTTALLYIDDFFKPIKDDYGTKPPTAADIRVAYEIINHRYINNMPTIISSERYISELMDIDEATASRIAEKSNGYCITIGREKGKNHRITKEDII